LESSTERAGPAAIDIRRLPSRTSVTVLLISAVVFGTLFSISAQAHYALFWPVLVAVVVLTFRRQLTWPERMARRGDYVAAGPEFGELIGTMRGLAHAMRIRRVPILLIREGAEGLSVFGTWRRWYIACGEEHARQLLAALRREETRDDVRAALIHELHHFGMGDHLWIGHARAILITSSAVLAWTAVFVLGSIAASVAATDYALTHAPSDFIEQQRELRTLLGFGEPLVEPPAEWVDRAYGLEDKRARLAHWDPWASALQILANTLPLVLVGVWVLRSYWRDLLRAREHYADVGTAASLGSVKPLMQSLVSLAPTRGSRPPAPRFWRRRLSPAAVLGLDTPAHPSAVQRLAVLRDPLAVFGGPRDFALRTGLFLLVLDAFFRLSSAAAVDHQWPRSLPFVAAYLLLGTHLLARVAGGRSWAGEALWMTALALAPLVAARLLGLAALGPILALAHRVDHGAVDLILRMAASYTGTGVGEALSVGVGGYLTGVVVPRVAEALGLGLVTSATVLASGAVIARIFTWYRHPSPRRAVVGAARGVLIAGAAGLGLALAPSLCHLVDGGVATPVWFGVSLLAGGTAMGAALLGLVAGQLLYGGRCPGCGARLRGSFSPGQSCPRCGHRPHEWLLTRYGVNP